MIVDGKIVKLKVWDTAGQKLYSFICDIFCNKAQGVILAYDITDK